jgi:phosphoribosyl 1,2-cyclic phosphodiesterase
LVEFNHDEEMLLEGPYPQALKQRVVGQYGHLSNAQSADLVRRGASPRLRHLVLGHLSQENNSPALALAAAKRALRSRPEVDAVTLHVASPTAATVARVPLWDFAQGAAEKSPVSPR